MVHGGDRVLLRASHLTPRCKHGRASDVWELRTAMASHVVFGKQVRALPELPRDRGIQALQDMVVTLEGTISTLNLDPRALTTDSG